MTNTFKQELNAEELESLSGYKKTGIYRDSEIPGTSKY
jgi:hypothetical protein